MFHNVAELLELTKKQNKTISEIMIEIEIKSSGKTREEIRAQMARNLKVMEDSVNKGIKGVTSVTGLTGKDAWKLQNYMELGRTLSEQTMLDAVAKAIAVNEVNAAMGIVCANPTAGSAGTVPGVLFSLATKLKLTQDQKIDFLFCAGAFGLITANNASISGAEGGCQAEVGTASAMAAAAATFVAGGTPEQSAEAFAMALANLLGLVCDPVAGLVEVPCIKRNAAGASNALVAADMALAGIKSEIPCDEVIEAMYQIGCVMPTSLKETAEGGLAATTTGKRLEEKVFGKSQKVCQ